MGQAREAGDSRIIIATSFASRRLRPLPRAPTQLIIILGGAHAPGFMLTCTTRTLEDVPSKI